MQRRDFKRQLERGESEERDIALYLGRLGWRTRLAQDYNKPGAPLLGGTSPLIEPDILGIRAGRSDAFECKWKERAVPRHVVKPPNGRRCDGTWSSGGCSLGSFCSGRRYTGIDRNNYDHYKEWQSDSGGKLFVVFLHEQENEVRIACLDDLDYNAPAPSIDCTQAQYPLSKGGMRNYWYDRIPLWMPYDEMKSNVTELRRTGHAPLPSRMREIPVPIAVAERPRPSIQTSMFSDVEDKVTGFRNGGSH